MKGKEQCDDEENEFGIAWIGNSTNLACKFSGAVNCGTIFISTSTYSALSDIDGKQKWEKVNVFKGDNVLDGYIAKQYYLQIDDNLEPYPAENSLETLSLADELKKEYNKHLANIKIRAEELGKKEQILQAKENQLNCKALEINQKVRKTSLWSRLSINESINFIVMFCVAVIVNRLMLERWSKSSGKKT